MSAWTALSRLDQCSLCAFWRTLFIGSGCARALAENGPGALNCDLSRNCGCCRRRHRHERPDLHASTATNGKSASECHAKRPDRPSNAMQEPAMPEVALSRVGTSSLSRKSLQFAPLPSSSGESRMRSCLQVLTIDRPAGYASTPPVLMFLYAPAAALAVGGRL